MQIRISVVFLAFTFAGCNQGSGDSDKMDGESGVTASSNDSAHRIYVQRKLDDSLRMVRLMKSGIHLYAVDSKYKCNLFKGYYFSDSPITDSSDLAFLVKHLADELFQTSKPDKVNCSYPLMSMAMMYKNAVDCSSDNDCIASCAITPLNYSGDVSVNMQLVKMNE